MKPLLIVLVVILGGCAPGSIPPAALDAWSDCVLRAVAQLDDGKTDPLSIAHGVAPRCAALYADATQSAVQGMITEKGQAHTRLLYKDNELRLITNAVLTSRAAKRS